MTMSQQLIAHGDLTWIDKLISILQAIIKLTRQCLGRLTEAKVRLEITSW